MYFEEMIFLFNCLTQQKSEGTNGQPTHPHGALSEDKSALIYGGLTSHYLSLQAVRGIEEIILLLFFN